MVDSMIQRSSICFDFTGYDHQVDVARSPDDRLYLDCGNALGPGVIDHHQLPAYHGSTTGLIVLHPELVSGSLRADREVNDPFTIVLHQQPDLDCLTSAYLAVCLLCDGTVPTGADAMARYVDDIDTGQPGFSLDRPFTLYTAYLLLVNDLCGHDRTLWHDLIEKGLQVVEFALGRVAADGVSILDVDAFECASVFRARDRREVQLDRDRYFDKLAPTSSSCRRYKLRLPCVFGGTQEVDALFARDVQNVDDPNRCIYFKDWARTDFENSPAGQGFQALSVFVPESPGAESDDSTGRRSTSAQVRRCILSVTPSSGVTLKGLGAQLELAESECRIKQLGVDDRVIDRKTGQSLPKRPGYDNADPWYDGRGHNYTIVDSPRSGTRLEAEQIENVFAQFGNRMADDAEPFWVPSPGDDSDSRFGDPSERQPAGGSGNDIAQMSALVKQWQVKNRRAFDDITLPEIFISYSRKKLDWVEANVVAPMIYEFGDGQIFFDKRSLQGGMSWLSELADGVMRCRLFIPVFCPPYFRSDFCQWELQLAITRDPTGQKRIVLPVMLEESELPAFCKLIQVQAVEGADFSARLVQMARAMVAK